EISLMNNHENANQYAHLTALSDNLHGMWYPTLRRTLAISQEMLMNCLYSLSHASNLIATKKSQMDGQLFLIQHLLLLREQIMPFNVEFALKESALDFDKLKDAIADFIKHKTDVFSLSNNAFLKLLLNGQHIVHESFIDSRREVDRLIKLTCEQYIDFCSNSIVKAFGKLDDSESEANGLPDSVTQVVCGIKTSISLYLNNKELEEALYQPIKQMTINQLQERTVDSPNAKSLISDFEQMI
ncbi:hypothetical protein GJ496_006359, partial [Pomphorhynchus laevis]